MNALTFFHYGLPNWSPSGPPELPPYRGSDMQHRFLYSRDADPFFIQSSNPPPVRYIYKYISQGDLKWKQYFTDSMIYAIDHKIPISPLYSPTEPLESGWYALENTFMAFYYDSNSMSFDDYVEDKNYNNHQFL